MSAPNTNIEKQARRHRGALWGIALAVLTAVILFVGYMTVIVDRGNEPEGADVQIDGRTGLPETAD